MNAVGNQAGGQVVPGHNVGPHCRGVAASPACRFLDALRSRTRGDRGRLSQTRLRSCVPQRNREPPVDDFRMNSGDPGHSGGQCHEADSAPGGTLKPRTPPLDGAWIGSGAWAP